MTEHKRLTTKEKYPHGAEGVSKDKLTGKYCRGVFEATACVEKLAEYETAEDEGRLVVLPCKVGSTVYRILYTLAFGEIGDKAEKHYFIRETSFEYGMIDDLNETVFLTREEAEKALEDMKKDE